MRGYKTCKKCGTSGLHWVQLNGKWRLAVDMRGYNLHQCIVKQDDPFQKPEKPVFKATPPKKDDRLDIGQRITVNSFITGFKGMTGRIIHKTNDGVWIDDWYAIELDEPVEIGHDCLGLCKPKYGVYVHKSAVDASI